MPTLNIGSSHRVVPGEFRPRPLLKTEDAQVSTTLTTTQLENLPNTDPENGYTYPAKAASRAPPARQGAPAMVAAAMIRIPQFDQVINGTVPYFSSYLIDGGSILAAAQRQHRSGPERSGIRGQRGGHGCSRPATAAAVPSSTSSPRAGPVNFMAPLTTISRTTI